MPFIPIHQSMTYACSLCETGTANEGTKEEEDSDLEWEEA